MSLLLAGASYRYAGAARPALVSVDLEVAAGAVVGIVGANESGKTTLCLVAAGLAPVTIGGELTGTVEIDELPSSRQRPHELAQRCGVLFQNPSTQLSGTTASVWEEIGFGPRNLGLSVDETVQRVEEAMRVVGISALAERDPSRLSGGQAQLVALASVLAMHPRYLVLDEPTSQLDPGGTELVGDALADLAQRTGAGVLLVEHKTDLLDRIADRVVVLEGGRVVERGEARALLGDARLAGWGVDPPARARLERAAAEAGVELPGGAA